MRPIQSDWSPHQKRLGHKRDSRDVCTQWKDHVGIHGEELAIRKQGEMPQKKSDLGMP